MKRVLAVLVALSIALPVAAQDPTAELLRAPRVNGAITFAFSNAQGGDLLYSIDTKTVGKSLTADTVFAIDDEVALVLQNYNPLKHQVKVDFADSEDPNFAQLKTVAGQISAFGKAIDVSFADVIGTFGDAPGQALAAGSNFSDPVVRDARSEAQRLLAVRVSDFKTASEAYESAAAAADSDSTPKKPCKLYDAYHRQLKAAARILLFSRKVATQKDLARWIGTSQGRAGTGAIAAEIRGAAEELATQVSTAHDAIKRLALPIKTEIEVDTQKESTLSELAVLKEALRTLSAAVAEPKKRPPAAAPTPAPNITEVASGCGFVRVESLSALAAIFDRADTFYRLKSNLKASLDSLAERLEAFVRSGEWAGKEGSRVVVPCRTEPCNDFVVARKSLGMETQSTVTLLVQALELKEQDDLSLALSDGSSRIEKKFKLRRHQFIVPDVAGAVVYSGLTRPTYVAAASGTGNVIKPAGSETPDYSVAAFLDGVLNIYRDGWAYPMFQLGLSLNKDLPTLFAGAGLRLSRPNRFGLAGGVAIGFIKDLPGGSKVGDPILDQAQLDGALKRKVKTSYYVALQYHF